MVVIRQLTLGYRYDVGYIHWMTVDAHVHSTSIFGVIVYVLSTLVTRLDMSFERG